MILSYSKLKVPIFFYLSLPAFLFLAFFLRLSVAIPCIAAYGLMLCFALRKDQTQKKMEKKITVSGVTLFILFLVVLLWTFLGGLNGHWFQTSDWDCRNAIFMDLITHRWPVRYQNGSALVYYIGHWLPEAAAAKLFLRFGGLELAWSIGQNLLWLWTSVGLYFLLLLLLIYHEVKNKKQILLVVLLLIFFSGMDIIGTILTGRLGEFFSPNELHLEWWSGRYQFSSITTCVYWVFNQSVIPWLAVMCFLHEKTPKNYVFLGIACLSCGPFPMVGLTVLMLVRGIEYLVEETGAEKYNWKKRILELFSPGNLLGCFVVLPVYILYYACNIATSQTMARESSGGMLERTIQQFSDNFIKSLICFVAFFVLEAGIYLVLIYRERKNDPLYYAVFVSLLLIPHFQIGLSMDFCMRVSIPALFLLMVYCGEYLLHHLNSLKKPWGPEKIRTLLIAACLLIGAVTPCVEIGRGVYHVITEQTIELAYDPIYSFENEPVTYNFSTEFPDKTVFFKYIGKNI